MITGRCWTPFTNKIPGFRTLADDCIVLVGARELDETESDLTFRPVVRGRRVKIGR